jgi:hypothetical protein
MGYAYKGFVKYAPPVKRLVFDTTKCGTRAGYRQHQNHGIHICTACRAANNEYMKAYYQNLRAAS